MGTAHYLFLIYLFCARMIILYWCRWCSSSLHREHRIVSFSNRRCHQLPSLFRRITTHPCPTGDDFWRFVFLFFFFPINIGAFDANTKLFIMELAFKMRCRDRASESERVKAAKEARKIDRKYCIFLFMNLRRRRRVCVRSLPIIVINGQMG